MVGFVNQVEFADGKIWVPNRQNLDNALLLKVLPPSAEEQRLTRHLPQARHRRAGCGVGEVLRKQISR